MPLSLDQLSGLSSVASSIHSPPGKSTTLIYSHPLTQLRRWSFYVLLIWAGIILVCVLFVPETFHPILLSKKAAALRKSTNNNEYHSASEVARASKSLSQTLLTSLYVPYQLLFLDPMVLALSTYTSLLQGILYLFFDVFPLVFGTNHGFNLWQVGLTFLGLLVGNLIACLFNPSWHKNWIWLIRRMREKHGAGYKPEPELRLPPAMVGSVLVTVALFWFAWTTYPSVHWIVPIIATVVFSTGYVLCSFLDNIVVKLTDIGGGQIFLPVSGNLDVSVSCVSHVCSQFYGR